MTCMRNKIMLQLLKKILNQNKTSKTKRLSVHLLYYKSKYRKYLHLTEKIIHMYSILNWMRIAISLFVNIVQMAQRRDTLSKIATMWYFMAVSEVVYFSLFPDLKSILILNTTFDLARTLKNWGCYRNQSPIPIQISVLIPYP